MNQTHISKTSTRDRSHAFLATVIVTGILAGAIASCASASIVSYTNYDAWSAATTGPVTSIFFTEVPQAFITDQYAELGVLFNNHPIHYSDGAFPSDGAGLLASTNGIGTITVEFTTLRTSVAADFTASMRLNLYAGDVFVGSSINPPTSATFIGVVSDVPFDRVEIQNYNSSIPLLDNLHFGAPIPAPATVVLLGLAGGSIRRRRRA